MRISFTTSTRCWRVRWERSNLTHGTVMPTESGWERSPPSGIRLGRECCGRPESSIVHRTLTCLMAFVAVSALLPFSPSAAHAIPIGGDYVFDTGLSGFLYLVRQTPLQNGGFSDLHLTVSFGEPMGSGMSSDAGSHIASCTTSTERPSRPGETPRHVAAHQGS